MSARRSAETDGGIGFFGALALLVIALKLTGAIDWSWLWVLAPLWGVFVAVLAALLIAVIEVAAKAMICGARAR